ncbi:MAG: hypothetical protein RLZZ111_1740 [Planctomycetota bacterium]|jgi:hypothetical protein
MTGEPHDPDEVFTELTATAAAEGPTAMLARLAATLRARRRWHALFDLRLLEARLALGLPATAAIAAIDPQVREQLDERSLAACLEVGWPLLEEGQVTAGWMYLRAAAKPADVARRLEQIAAEILAAAAGAGETAAHAGNDEAAAARLEEILNVALWEGIDPALGIRLVLQSQGTCSAITAFEQAVSRLPAARQESAAALLVHHLHDEVTRALAADLEHRGIPVAAAGAEAALPELLAAVGPESQGLHVDVSHLQSVLRIARVCTAPATVRAAWELACYACRLPREVVYPGEPPFEDVGQASRLFYGAQLGHDVAEAVAAFRRAATLARINEAGTLPADTLVLLLHRLGRHREALHAALERPAEGPMPSTMLASGMLPTLVELAAAADGWDELLEACRSRGDEITFATALAARSRQVG